MIAPTASYMAVGFFYRLGNSLLPALRYVAVILFSYIYYSFQQ